MHRPQIHGKRFFPERNLLHDFTAAALTAGTAETVTSGKLGKVESHKFEGLDYGYYLVYQTGTKEIQSSLVSVDKPEARGKERDRVYRRSCIWRSV